MASPTTNDRHPLLSPATSSLLPLVPNTIQIDPALLARAIQIASAERAASNLQLQRASHPAPNTLPLAPAILASAMQIDTQPIAPALEQAKGQPTLSLPDGQYVGEVKDGLPHGMGTMTYRKGLNGKKYEGQWQNGVIHGWGITEYTNGDKYEGDQDNGRVHGQGKYTYADGSTYEGGWENGSYHGKGTKKFTAGDTYIGVWDKGKIHGQGKYTWASGRWYNGNWQDSKRHGQGRNTEANGDYYEGEWVADKKNGRGRWVYNYHVYEGEFKDNKFWSGTWSGGVSTPNHGTYVNGKSQYAKSLQCSIL